MKKSIYFSAMKRFYATIDILVTCDCNISEGCRDREQSMLFNLYVNDK